jgi:teichuronic acid biosynthesis glycosyltransferase TuaG|tara:strand:+ start:111 stop:872 length:762 start_codon:yes stop_codon:yes gene_type:complete
MNLVTVIIPYYKNRNFIKDCLVSVLKQTYKNLEIIIIYDDTNHKDLIYIKTLTHIDSRVKIIVNKKNLGAGNSRNIGIQKSKGKFISFIDADDIWKLHKIKYQVDRMIKFNLNCTHTSYGIIDKKNNIIGKRIARDFMDYKSLLKSCDIGLSTVMIKREVLTKDCKFANLKTKEDFIFWLKILRNRYKFIAIKAKLTNWRNTPDSLSSSSVQRIKDAFTVYFKYENFNMMKSIFYVSILSFNFLKKSLLQKKF